MLKRLKRRYLAVQIDSAEKFSQKEFMDAVWGSLSKLYGEYGASRSGLAPISYNEQRGLAVLRALHDEVQNVRAAVAAVTKINGKPTALHVEAVSGTIKSLRNITEH